MLVRLDLAQSQADQLVSFHNSMGAAGAPGVYHEGLAGRRGHGNILHKGADSPWSRPEQSDPGVKINN